MLPAKHSDILWKKIHLAEGRLNAASDCFWNAPELRQIFPQFLIQLYHVVSGGIDLMSSARTRAAGLPDDPVASIAAAYLAQHIEEEKDHAGWLLRDIATLGIAKSSVRAAKPMDSVVSLLGAQRYWLVNSHPVALFGYLLVLEGSPPIVEQLDLIQKRTGLPATAFRCLRSHAEDDPTHLIDLNRTLDRMPLTPEQGQSIALSAFHTIDAAAGLLDELRGLRHTPIQAFPQAAELSAHA